jgi:hypothetical protein
MNKRHKYVPMTRPFVLEIIREYYSNTGQL